MFSKICKIINKVILVSLVLSVTLLFGGLIVFMLVNTFAYSIALGSALLSMFIIITWALNVETIEQYAWRLDRKIEVKKLKKNIKIIGVDFARDSDKGEI